MPDTTTITVGIDIGSTASKAVVLEDGQVSSFHIGPSTVNPRKTAKAVYLKVLSDAGLDEEQVAYVIGTGYGRAKVEFADDNVSEISCHAKGTHHLLPEVRTIIDIGGQDIKAIGITPAGMIREFAMNDKCAAGTGRFLDFMARSMDMDITEMADVHFQEGEPAIISSVCSVFAESEVISLINEEVPLPSIIKGLHKSVALRLNTLARRVGIQEEIVTTGGVAKNKGVVQALEDVLAARLATFPDQIDPQIIGALGAAVVAADRAVSKANCPD